MVNLPILLFELKEKILTKETSLREELLQKVDNVEQNLRILKEQKLSKRI